MGTQIGTKDGQWEGDDEVVERLTVGQYSEEERAENRRIWVEALRSGKYRQASHALRLDGEAWTLNEPEEMALCCLGVACEISGLASWEMMQNGIHLFLGSSSSLPVEVADWLGMRSSAGDYDYMGTRPCPVPEGMEGEGSLAALNDKGATFEQIAKMIEAEPEGMFFEPVLAEGEEA